MGNKNHWGGRPNPPPLNWDKPGKPVIRSISGVEPPEEHLLHEYDIRLTNENWKAILGCLDDYQANNPQHTLKPWHKRVDETVLAKSGIEDDPKKRVWVRLRNADLDEVIRQVHEVCARRDAAWVSWANKLEGALNDQRGGGRAE